jgi:hypothetical protein
MQRVFHTVQLIEAENWKNQKITVLAIYTASDNLSWHSVHYEERRVWRGGLCVRPRSINLETGARAQHSHASSEMLIIHSDYLPI